MELDLRHEKTLELTGIEIKIDKGDISMLKAGIPRTQMITELGTAIEINLKKQKIVEDESD